MRSTGFLDYADYRPGGDGPCGLSLQGGEMKYLVEPAVRSLIPARIMERKDKMGFPVPLHIWAGGPCREFFNDILLSPRARQRGIFDQDEVRGSFNYQRPLS